MTVKKTRIIFLGPPGSGKGTQAQLISKKFRIPHISTGEIFRKIISTNKPQKLASAIKKYVQNGLLVPDEIVFRALKSVLDTNGKFLLDGYPRNIKQAQLLDDYLGDNGIDIVIYFKVPDKEIIKRLTARRTCPKCGRVYNIYTLKPKKDNLCDVCNVKLIIRQDDKVTTVKKRLKIYKEDTMPLVEYYKKRNLLVEINANDTVDNVYNSVVKILEK
ncbi:MAG: nucleoside monophosphate kinase [Endomicrobia bacterium]|nr:nucleoside monophosphate kinase [Endomicrobiia bacterium]MCX7941410.1 nucleoside monophosphate kinase [Endomicrobiia bacterium]MDW8055486.1 nucleoside monophosphate kinase [Elusimicrobiota bacterium]